MITASRYHDIDAGHRLYKHGGKCASIHGHSYRVHFTVASDELDNVGRVLDFSVIKERLCQWLEDNWDHRFLIWRFDPLAEALLSLDPTVVRVPFNPSAENMAHHLLTVVGPQQLADLPVNLIKVTVEETRKCSATATL